MSVKEVKIEEESRVDTGDGNGGFLWKCSREATTPALQARDITAEIKQLLKEGKITVHSVMSMWAGSPFGAVEAFKMADKEDCEIDTKYSMAVWDIIDILQNLQREDPVAFWNEGIKDSALRNLVPLATDSAQLKRKLERITSTLDRYSIHLSNYTQLLKQNFNKEEGDNQISLLKPVGKEGTCYQFRRVIRIAWYSLSRDVERLKRLEDKKRIRQQIQLQIQQEQANLNSDNAKEPNLTTVTLTPTQPEGEAAITSGSNGADGGVEGVENKDEAPCQPGQMQMGYAHPHMGHMGHMGGGGHMPDRNKSDTTRRSHNMCNYPQYGCMGGQQGHPQFCRPFHYQYARRPRIVPPPITIEQVELERQQAQAQYNQCHCHQCQCHDEGHGQGQHQDGHQHQGQNQNQGQGQCQCHSHGHGHGQGHDHPECKDESQGTEPANVNTEEKGVPHHMESQPFEVSDLTLTPGHHHHDHHHDHEEEKSYAKEYEKQKGRLEIPVDMKTKLIVPVTPNLGKTEEVEGEVDPALLPGKTGAALMEFSSNLDSSNGNCPPKTANNNDDLAKVPIAPIPFSGVKQDFGVKSVENVVRDVGGAEGLEDSYSKEVVVVRSAVSDFAESEFGREMDSEDMDWLNKIKEMGQTGHICADEIEAAEKLKRQSIYLNCIKYRADDIHKDVSAVAATVRAVERKWVDPLSRILSSTNPKPMTTEKNSQGQDESDPRSKGSGDKDEDEEGQDGNLTQLELSQLVQALGEFCTDLSKGLEFGAGGQGGQKSLLIERKNSFPNQPLKLTVEDKTTILELLTSVTNEAMACHKSFKRFSKMVTTDTKFLKELCLSFPMTSTITAKTTTSDSPEKENQDHHPPPPLPPHVPDHESQQPNNNEGNSKDDKVEEVALKKFSNEKLVVDPINFEAIFS